MTSRSERGPPRRAMGLCAWDLAGSSECHYLRGRVIIQDREKLEDIAGDAYGGPEAEYRRLIGPIGRLATRQSCLSKARASGRIRCREASDSPRAQARGCACNGRGITENVTRAGGHNDLNLIPGNSEISPAPISNRSSPVEIHPELSRSMDDIIGNPPITVFAPAQSEPV